MGNENTSFQMSNYSKSNIRVFVTNTALEIDAFIAPESADGDNGWRKRLRELPKDKKFCFKKEPKSVHVLAAQTQAVQWEPGNFVSIFVEDEDDENVCTKLIIRNMELGSPHPVLLYDV